MSDIAFLDFETTSLDDELGEVWEIGLIDDASSAEYCWLIRPKLNFADPNALRIGKYYQRNFIAYEQFGSAYRNVHPEGRSSTNVHRVARELAVLLAGKTVIGAVPDFDFRFGRRFLREHNEIWAAHYHLIDIETLVAGYLLARGENPSLPWKSDDLSRAVGVNPEDFDRHTALGDCRWVRAQYQAVTGQKVRLA